MPEVKTAGRPLAEASKIAVMIHGRGASATGILSLQNNLKLDDYALIAPQAPNNTWYPYSFMAPDQNNEPYFSRAIATIDELVKEILASGFSHPQIFFIGFSQGACLTLEYAAQHAYKYGGVIAFTGGLIGEHLNPAKYAGDFEGTRVFIGASHRDLHVPLVRIEESAALLEKMGAQVKTMISKDTQHMIRAEEIAWVNDNILK